MIEKMYHHFGGIDGTHTHSSFMLEHNIGLVVLNNESHMSSKLTSRGWFVNVSIQVYMIVSICSHQKPMWFNCIWWDARKRSCYQIKQLTPLARFLACFNLVPIVYGPLMYTICIYVVYVWQLFIGIPKATDE